MDFFEEWLEHDYNPFILFDNEGKVLYVNREAHYLLGNVSAKKLFELAFNCADISYGYKTTIMDIEFANHSFFALTVGYSDDDKIGIKLYKKPVKSFKIDKEGIKRVNIYTLIDLAISSISTQKKIIHEKRYDPTFPEIFLKVDMFLKLLIKSYNSFKNSNIIITDLSLVTGEYVVYKDRKYPILSLKIVSENRDFSDDDTLKNIAVNSNSTITLKKDSVDIRVAFIQKND